IGRMPQMYVGVDLRPHYLPFKKHIFHNYTDPGLLFSFESLLATRPDSSIAVRVPGLIFS
ncbi:MAG TPA: hypothetical protein PL029_08210, partial [Bacteroidia bacterium]|nr:hypothetical protein [Bacteroidia bacterium]